MNATPDLLFCPVENDQPMALSPEQIRDYNQCGFISPLTVFTGNGVVHNRRYFDSLLNQVPETGAYSINCYQARCTGIWDLCSNAVLLDLVEDIIGPNIVCWASHFFCKLPGDTKTVPWHQDASYWKLSPARTVTAWLAIDDVDETNSAMRFLPESHNLGHLEFREVTGDSALRLETVGVEQLGQPYSNNLKAGQVSLHADMLVHGSLPNMSNRRRCGLTIRYCPPEVIFTDSQWASKVEAIVCRGRDPYDRWTHNRRPVGNDVSLANSPHSVGGN